MISGHRRLLAARHLGWKTVPARILSIGEKEALRIRLIENLHHEPLGEVEIAEALERSFLAQDGDSIADEGRVIGLDEERVWGLRSLLRASPTEREAMIELGSGGERQVHERSRPRGGAR